MIPIELMQALQSNNPMMYLQQNYGNTPAFHKAAQMMQGKSPEQIQQVVINLARQRGMDINQVMQMANTFGLKL